jgi:hypothetical protein
VRSEGFLGCGDCNAPKVLGIAVRVGSQYPLGVFRTNEITDFREKLIRAFPPKPFYGQVSLHNECDEGIALLKELPGKRWDEIPADFIDFNSGSLPLLEPKALVAFLPAWLLRSVETLGDKSVLSEFSMYFLCHKEEIAGRVSLFNDAQRSVVADFLRSIVGNDEVPYWQPYAEHGLKWWSG